LVKRILDSLSSSEVLETTSSVASELPEGVVSGKQLARATQLRARAGLTHADVGMSEKEFQNEQRAEVTKASDYSRAFASPHDVARMLVEARADDICIIDVRGHCAFTDYMVVATGRSSQLVHMLAQAVLHELKQRCREVAPGVAPGIEGDDEVDAQWLVVDAGSVVVHIFAEGARKEYNLEALWGGKNNVTRVATPQRNIQSLHTIRA
jgi:ribosome silencing factor RsfS/YbeB/iojap